MKKILTLVFIFPLFVFAQIDTVTVAGKTYSGKVKNIYSDRFVFQTSDDVEYIVMRNRLDAIKVRDQIVVKGQAAWQYSSDIDYFFKGNLPEYHDQKYYLKESGVWGVTASTLIVSGGILAGIGGIMTERKYAAGSTVTILGSALGSLGTAFLIPTFIQILKAGKVKTYRML